MFFFFQLGATLYICNLPNQTCFKSPYYIIQLSL